MLSWSVTPKSPWLLIFQALGMSQFQGNCTCIPRLCPLRVLTKRFPSRSHHLCWAETCVPVPPDWRFRRLRFLRLYSSMPTLWHPPSQTAFSPEAMANVLFTVICMVESLAEVTPNSNLGLWWVWVLQSLQLGFPQDYKFINLIFRTRTCPGSSAISLYSSGLLSPVSRNRLSADNDPLLRV